MNLIPLEQLFPQDLPKLGKILNILAKKESPNVCIYQSSGENPCIPSGYIILPKALLQELSIRLIAKEFDDDTVKILVHILHPFIINKELKDVFLTIDEFDKKYECLPPIFQSNQHYCIFKDFILTPKIRITQKDHPLHWANGYCVVPYVENRCNKFRITMSEKILTSSNLFIDSEHEGYNDLLPKEASLTPYLDPNHHGYSTQLAAAVNTWMDIHVRKLGDPKFTPVQQAKKILNENYSHNLEKTPRDRIATWINPDNKKTKKVKAEKTI